MGPSAARPKAWHGSAAAILGTRVGTTHREWLLQDAGQRWPAQAKQGISPDNVQTGAEKPQRFMSVWLDRIQPTCIADSEAAKVSARGEDTPNARRAFADPRP